MKLLKQFNVIGLNMGFLTVYCIRPYKPKFPRATNIDYLFTIIISLLAERQGKQIMKIDLGIINDLIVLMFTVFVKMHCSN